MEFLIKVIAPEDLRQKDILEDLRSGLHYHVGSGDPTDPYLIALRRVKLVKVQAVRTVKKLTRLAAQVTRKEAPHE